MADNMKLLFLLIVLLSAASSENDLFLNFCGTWHHGGGGGDLSLNVSLSPGCAGLSVSAGRRSLSVRGRITARCRRDDVVPLGAFGLRSEGDLDFCVFWEPLLDTLKLQIGGQNLTLCWPARPRDSCCTDLSHGSNSPEAEFGIKNGKIRGDAVSSETRVAYNFNGSFTDCKALCNQWSGGSPNSNMLNRSVQLQDLEHPCAQRLEVETKESRSYNITSPITEGGDPAVSVQLPPALTAAARNANVSLTFHTNNNLFQAGHSDLQVLRHVVEITVENKIISNLPEPVRIAFQHQVVLKTHSRKCVSWDTRRDPWLVNWLVDGCETVQRGDTHTDCLCNHLTYFTVLLELDPGPVRHLLPLTVITSLGCAVSFISCVALSVHLCKKRKRPNEQSPLIHLGLSVSVGALSLLFFLTGVLANVGGPGVCVWVGALLHYTMLCSFAWMGIEVFHTFWLVYMVFSPSPRPYIWTLLGFGLPPRCARRRPRCRRKHLRPEEGARSGRPRCAVSHVLDDGLSRLPAGSPGHQLDGGWRAGAVGLGDALPGLQGDPDPGGVEAERRGLPQHLGPERPLRDHLGSAHDDLRPRHGLHPLHRLHPHLFPRVLPHAEVPPAGLDEEAGQQLGSGQQQQRIHSAAHVAGPGEELEAGRCWKNKNTVHVQIQTDWVATCALIRSSSQEIVFTVKYEMLEVFKSEKKGIKYLILRSLRSCESRPGAGFTGNSEGKESES